MAKGKAEDKRKEATDPPMSRTLRSRKREYPDEKHTDQNTEAVNTEDTLLHDECLAEDGDQKCNLPSESLLSDQHGSKTNAEPDIPEVTPCDLTKQLVIRLTDCGQEKQEKQNMAHEDDASVSANTLNVENAEIKEEQMCAEDNSDHNMETNPEVDKVHQTSKESVFEGSVKKRRRMGMCQLSEKERSQFLVKCSNKVESTVKTENNIDVTSEETGPSDKVTSSNQESTRIIQQSCIKPDANQNNVLDRTEPGSQMIVLDPTVTVCESGRNVNKDSYQTLVIHPSAQEEPARKETEEYFTVTVWDVPSLNLDKDDSSQKPHSEQLMSRSESEVNVAATLPHVPDIVCESQNPESKTDLKVQGEGPLGPHQPVALSDENKHWNKHEPKNDVEAKMAKQQIENISANGDVNFNPSHIEELAVEMALPVQETESKTTVDMDINRVVGGCSESSHSSTSCSSIGNGHRMNGTPDSSTATMGPPKPADFNDPRCSLDYVSDSQLNTIVLTEQVMAAENRVCPEHDVDDGTDLIRGLIIELSSLNRTVMATHRELENLRRRGKRNTVR